MSVSIRSLTHRLAIHRDVKLQALNINRLTIKRQSGVAPFFEHSFASLMKSSKSFYGEKVLDKKQLLKVGKLLIDE